ILEKRHADGTAMFLAGCGADANPMPRGTMELVDAHGTSLADAVDRVLNSQSPIAATLHTAYGTVDLPFVDEATRANWHNQLKIDAIYLERHAAVMKRLMERNGRLPVAERDPIQVWEFGAVAVDSGVTALSSAGEPAGFTLVALGGEVVVDYALRLAREYPA